MSKSSKKALALAVLCAVSSMGFAGYASAEESEHPEFMLDSMVVTATRTMKELKEVPSSVSVVTAEEIKERNVTSVQEALQYMPGVYMAQNAQGGISLRGYSGSNVLVLVDGVQMNDTYDGGVNFNMIPVENIERIEVLRGAASSIYGGHAVGGVINIITKEPEEGTHVNAALSYGSNNTWKKALNLNAKVNDKWSFGVGYENRKSDGYPGYFRSASAEPGTGDYSANLPQLSDGSYVYGGRGDKDWEHENYSAFVKYNFDDSKSLKYAYSKYKTDFSYKNPFTYVRDANGRPVWNGSVTTQDGNVINIKASSFYGYDNINERDTHNLVYHDEDNKFTTSFSYLNDKKSGFSSASVPKNYPDMSWEGEGDYSSHPGKIYNFNIEKAWENIGKHNIVVGANLKQEEMIQDRYILSNWKDQDSKTEKYAQDKGEVKNAAIFIQDEYKLSEPVTMYLGLRYDHYKKGSGNFWSTEGEGYNETSASATYNEISPKVAFDFEADEDTHYYVSYGHSFNPPPIYQIYRYSEFDSYWYVPNPDLDPETSDTFEICMKKTLNDKTNIGVTLYHVDTDDKIAASGILPGETYKGKGVKKYMNFDSEERNGVEFEVNHKFSDKFSGYLNYAWQQGKLEKNGEESNQYEIPKHLFHAGLEYNYDKWNALLDCQYVSARQAPDSANGEYGAEDAYFLVNAGVNYEISKGVTLQFAVNNLLDREFYASEANSGRTYTVGMRYSF